MYIDTSLYTTICELYKITILESHTQIILRRTAQGQQWYWNDIHIETKKNKHIKYKKTKITNESANQKSKILQYIWTSKCINKGKNPNNDNSVPHDS